jgi:hypothetical protein
VYRAVECSQCWEEELDDVSRRQRDVVDTTGWIRGWRFFVLFLAGVSFAGWTVKFELSFADTGLVHKETHLGAWLAVGDDGIHSWLVFWASIELVVDCMTYPVAAGCTNAALDTIFDAKNTGWRIAGSYLMAALVGSFEATFLPMFTDVDPAFCLVSWKASGTIIFDDLHVFWLKVLSVTGALDSQRSREARTLDPLDEAGREKGSLPAAGFPSSFVEDTDVEVALALRHISSSARLLGLSWFEPATDDALVTAEVTDASSELDEDLPDKDGE